MPQFTNTKIVLIKTTHPGNIGGSARAMATMGFNNLTLISPKFFPHKTAEAMAVSAKPILDNAQVYKNLDNAIGDCALVLGLTARMRDNTPNIITIRQATQKWAEVAQKQKCAFLFGTESSGLENEAIYQCHHLVTIPVSPDFSSLNLASAVQLVCYEARIAALGDIVPTKFNSSITLPTSTDINYLAEHFERIINAMDYLQAKRKMTLFTRLQLMLNRLSLQKPDLLILRGFLKEVERRLK